MATPAHTTGVPTPDPDLEALLATEQRLEAALAQARADAEVARAAADAAIALADAAAERELAAARELLEAALVAETEAQRAALAAGARTEAAGWNALDGTALDVAAALLRRRLVALIAEVG